MPATSRSGPGRRPAERSQASDRVAGGNPPILALPEPGKDLPALSDARHLAVAHGHHEVPAVNDLLNFAGGGLDRVGLGPESASRAKLLPVHENEFTCVLA